MAASAKGLASELEGSACHLVCGGENSTNTICAVCQFVC